MKSWQKRMLQVVWIVLLVAGVIGMLPIFGSIAGMLLNVLVRNEFIAFVMGVVLVVLGVLVCVASHKFAEKDSTSEETELEEEDDETAEISKKSGGWQEV